MKNSKLKMIENTRVEFKEKVLYKFIFYFLVLFFFSFYTDQYYISLGFALKGFMVLSLFVFMFTYKKIKFDVFTYEFFLILFFTMYITTSFFAVDMISSLRLSLGIVLMLSVYFLLKFLLPYINERYNLEKIILSSYAFFLIISLLLYSYGIFQINADFYTDNIKIYGVMIDRHIPRMIGVTSDPNFFGLYTSIFLFYLLLKKNKTYFEKFLFLLSSILILLSFSRGAIISISLVMIIYYFFLFLKIFIKTKASKDEMFQINISFLLFFVFLFVFLQSEDLRAMFYNRVETLDSGSGRFQIWKNGLSLFQENYFFGIGIYNFLYYNIHYFNDGHYMHNTHLEVLVESGIIGFVAYITFHILLLIKLIKLVFKNNKYLYLILTYFVIILQLAGISAIINEVVILFLAYCAYVFSKEKSNAIANINN